MRTIVKLAILVGLILQGSPGDSFSQEGWVWRDDIQESVHLQTETRRIGWPWVYVVTNETSEFGHLWGEVTSKDSVVRPLGVSFTGGFWLIVLWLLDYFWPGGGDHA